MRAGLQPAFCYYNKLKTGKAGSQYLLAIWLHGYLAKLCNHGHLQGKDSEHAINKF
jgi:hypothetical protein